MICSSCLPAERVVDVLEHMSGSHSVTFRHSEIQCSLPLPVQMYRTDALAAGHQEMQMAGEVDSSSLAAAVPVPFPLHQVGHYCRCCTS